MMKSKDKGFSLIELIFVIALLAIIMGIVITAYPGLTYRMQVRADRSSAMYITRALRVWYTDSISDLTRKESFTGFINDNLYNKTILLSDLKAKGLDHFVDPNYKPKSLKDSNGSLVGDQNFYVGMIEVNEELKFFVTVESDENRISQINSDSSANYDGSSIGIIYIER